MDMLLRVVIIVVLIAIMASLGTALFHLSSARGDSRKLLRALMLRVGLSLALFVLVMLAWWAGLIAPHSLPLR